VKKLDQILQRCKQQDRAAQKQLYSLTYTHLAVAVAVYSKDNSERDWIFNLGMMKIFTSLEKFQAGTNYLGWARTLLVRSAIDHYRKNKKHTDNLTPLDDSKKQITSRDFEEMMNDLETDSIIQLLQKLSERERIVFSMNELDGYSHKEIQELTGINSNTSKWLLAKAKKSLKTMIQKASDLKIYGYGK